jgi:hypothetical protein
MSSTNSLSILSTNALIDAYKKAISLNLDVEFQYILLDELIRRNIDPSV